MVVKSHIESCLCFSNILDVTNPTGQYVNTIAGFTGTIGVYCKAFVGCCASKGARDVCCFTAFAIPAIAWIVYGAHLNDGFGCFLLSKFF